MLTQIKIERYKSLYDVTINLEPLTVFIGPNGSGKSNVCEALEALAQISKGMFQILPNKFWQGQPASITFSFSIKTNGEITSYNIVNGIKSTQYFAIFNNIVIYDFNPASISIESSMTLKPTGEGLANSLADILLENHDRFTELEKRFTQLVPNISRISLKRQPDKKYYSLRLVDKYSDHLIPATDISDGTLRLLAFLTAIYAVEQPTILCFEEPENGVHPWLLHKIVELLNLVATEGIAGQPVQVLITTHSPVLLNYVKPEQVRAVELDKEGKTQIHALPLESTRFQAALEAYDHELGELWFTNLLGGNPQ